MTVDEVNAIGAYEVPTVGYDCYEVNVIGAYEVPTVGYDC